MKNRQSNKLNNTINNMMIHIDTIQIVENKIFCDYNHRRIFNSLNHLLASNFSRLSLKWG